jgi:hypothetical protein
MFMWGEGKNRFHWALRQGLQENPSVLLDMANIEVTIPSESGAMLFAYPSICAASP